MDDSYAQQPDGTWRNQDHQSPPASQPLARGRPKPANQQSPVPSLPTLSLSQLLTRPLPQQLWLVEPLLSRGGVMGLAGDPGTAKTWLILELARSVATGRPFLDRFPTQQGPVLIIDEENGEARLQRRLARITGQIIDDCPIHIASMCGVNLSHDRWIDSLHGKVIEIKPILILFDSLIRVHRGGENSAEDMATLFAVFTSFRHDFDCAVVFTHHLRKMGFIRDLGQRIRGSSDILAYVDSMLGLTKVETAYTLWHLKNRDGDLIKPLSLSVEDTDGNTTVIRVIGEVDEESSKREHARDLIMYALADGDKLREELAVFIREAGISDRTLSAALRELETAKLIVGTLEGRKRKYSIFEPSQPSQPIYNTLRGLRRSHPNNGELTSEEKDLLVKHWTDRGKPTVTLGRSQWFNLEAMLYSTDNYLAQKRRDHTPALRQILVRWSNNHTEVPNESIEVRPGE
jgi:DNA-binding HxlR family transcriptional regulator